MILADGTCIIMTYDSASETIGESDGVKSSFLTLPIGFGKSKKYPYISNVMEPIAFVMDVNGYRGPNKGTTDSTYYDIRSFNLARFSKAVECTAEVNGFGCVYILPSWGAMALNDPDIINYDPDWQKSTHAYGTANYWAGAAKSCDLLDMKLPSTSELQKLVQKNSSEKLNISASGYFWTSDLYNVNNAYLVKFNTGEINHGNRGYSGYSAICVDK